MEKILLLLLVLGMSGDAIAGDQSGMDAIPLEYTYSIRKCGGVPLPWSPRVVQVDDQEEESASDAEPTEEYAYTGGVCGGVPQFPESTLTSQKSNTEEQNACATEQE